MAAKQGLTAQLSQAGEDAKRAVLSRTGVTSSWFSNLNTVCTIKSAPPRTPEVLQMLATKSGWLYKRNEQHVWQSRWCCVVPHMFLYYFDANIGVGSGETPSKLQQNPTTEQQEAWNRAVQKGYGNRKQHEKRSSLYLFNQGTSTAANKPDGGANGAGGDSTDHDIEGGAAVTADSTKYATLQPSGIIDLECYSTVHRSTYNELVLELAGDDQVNPDLRAFYFCASNEEDCESWTSALLNGRHAALVDECDAYKQVCEGFASQLQLLHSDLDQAHLTASEAQDELYRVRSQQEDHRRATWRSMEEAVMNSSSSSPELEKKKVEFRANLDTVRAQDLGVQAAVRMMLEYTKGIEDMYEKLYEEKKRLESDLKATGQSDQAKVQDLSFELSEMKSKFEQEKKQWETQLETATAKYVQSQKELQDVQRDLSSTKMEITMFQTQQRNKIAELQQHKKILKKEVIDLRTKLENANSELGVLKHREEKLSLQTEQERQKSALLERYVEKIESQVKVQQNVMEMMSACGSVYGGGSAPAYDHSPAGRRGVVYVRTTDEGPPSEHDDDDGDVVEGLVPMSSTELRRRRSAADDDNRSHVSELTEDRTQRQFEVFQRDFSQQGETGQNNLRSQRSRLQVPSPRGIPPAFIGVGNGENGGDQQTATGAENVRSGGSVPPIGLPPRSDTRVRDSMSTSGISEKRLSVAERARLNADRQSTPVKLRVDDSVVKAVEESKRTPFSVLPSPLGESSPTATSSENSVIRRMGEALMGTRSNNDYSDDDGDDTTSIYSTRVTDYTDASPASSPARDSRRRGDSEEKKMSDSVSNLSLAERSEMQRQLQLKFLQEKGLIKNPSDLRGGAGSSIAGDENSSVASSVFSRARSVNPLTKSGQNV
ncbi:hypothetical protein ACA910_005131 [Epithemia clementina (nom. ined.)]